MLARHVSDFTGPSSGAFFTSCMCRFGMRYYCSYYSTRPAVTSVKKWNTTFINKTKFFHVLTVLAGIKSWGRYVPDWSGCGHSSRIEFTEPALPICSTAPICWALKFLRTWGTIHEPAKFVFEENLSRVPLDSAGIDSVSVLPYTL